MIRWPWTNLHELNLDWIIQKMKELIERVNAFGDRITVGSVETLPAGSAASVVIRGNLDDGLAFDFEIPRGDRGATGPQGPQGETGATGPQGPQGPAGQDGTMTLYNAQASADGTGSMQILANSSRDLIFDTQLVMSVDKLRGIKGYRIGTASSTYPVSMTCCYPSIDSTSSHLVFNVSLYNLTSSALSIPYSQCVVFFTYSN